MNPSAKSSTYFSLRAFIRRIAWAILRTNLFGMPLILVFVLILMSIPFTQIVFVFKNSPALFSLGFGLIIFIAIVFVIGHFFWVLRYLRPVIDYFRAERKGRENLKSYAEKALLNCLNAPYFVMILSIIFYFIGIMLLIGVLNILFKFVMGQAFSLILVPFSVGVLISFFQSFSSSLFIFTPP